MRKIRRKGGGSARRLAALGLALIGLASAFSGVGAAADTVPERRIADVTGETQELLATAAAAKLGLTGRNGEAIPVRRNGMIRGRGLSDERTGEEPEYFGMVGYAAVADNGSMSLAEDSMRLPWTVPSYLRIDNRWYISRPIPHKTAVLVIGQRLKEKSPGVYTGRLQVVRLDLNEICWMNAENFVTVPYWFYTTRRTLLHGSSIAVFRPGEGSLPVTADGTEYRVAEDTRILIPGNGAWGGEIPENGALIPGIIFRRTGRKTKPLVLFFREKDLALVY